MIKYIEKYMINNYINKYDGDETTFPPVKNKRLSDDFDTVSLLVDVLADQKHIRKEEQVNVHFGGRPFPQLEIALLDQLAGLVGCAARHGASQVQVTAAGQQTLQLLVLCLLNDRMYV